MSPKRFVLSRRQILRGALGGVSVGMGLPCLDAMLNTHGTAYAADGAPILKRMGVFFFGAGGHKEWSSAPVGPLTLPVGLTPLERHKKYITVVSGLSSASFGDFGTNRHFMGASAVLAGTPPVGERAGGASIDQLAAASLKGGTRTSLEISVTDSGAISYSGANSPNPPLSDPRKVMERLFGGLPGAAGTPTTPDKKLRALYLDAVRQDTERLRMRLGVHDQRRLDGYVDGIREIEREVSALPTSPAAGAGATCGPGADATRGVTDDTIRNRGNSYVLINQAQAKLTAAALACGQTQVFSYNFSSPNSTPWFRVTPGLANNHHELGHQLHADLPRSVAFIMERFAELLDALVRFPEGDGKSVLDSTGIMVTSEVARNHEGNNMPIILAGGLFKGGQHIRATGLTTRASLTTARAAGATVASFGKGEAQTTEVIRDAIA